MAIRRSCTSGRRRAAAIAALALILSARGAHAEAGDWLLRSLNLEGGPVGIVEWGELPSAGDTAYAGVAGIGRGRFLVSWYSSDVQEDPSWVAGLFAPSDIWLAAIDLRRLPHATPAGR